MQGAQLEIGSFVPQTAELLSGDARGQRRDQNKSRSPAFHVASPLEIRTLLDRLAT